MTTMTQITTINELFMQFLNEHGSEDMVQEWQKQKYQEKLMEFLPKATKTSGKKDPNKPKGCKSSYIFFCCDYREEVKKDLGNANSKEITAELARRWHAMKDSTKAVDIRNLSKYEDLAKSDKERYITEMADYDPPIEEEMEECNPAKKRKKASGKKDPNKPKRGKSAYLFFCTEHRDEAKAQLGEEAKTTEVTAELGRMWNELKESTKEKDKKKLSKYEDLAKSDKERYLSEMEGYEKPSDDNKDDKITEELTPPTKDNPKSSGKKSSGKKINGYILFSKEHREKVKEENHDMSATAVTKIIAGMWKNLTEEEQTEWKTRATEM